jgi:hypothetical protein
LTVKTSVILILWPVSLKDISGLFSTPRARIGGSADRQFEEAGWRSIDAAMLVHRRHQRDRTRNDSADHQRSQSVSKSKEMDIAQPAARIGEKSLIAPMKGLANGDA